VNVSHHWWANQQAVLRSNQSKRAIFPTNPKELFENLRPSGLDAAPVKRRVPAVNLSRRTILAILRGILGKNRFFTWLVYVEVYELKSSIVPAGGRMSEASDEPSAADEAFVSQLAASQGRLHAFIRGLVPHQGDADDILQEVNLALWRKKLLFGGDDDFLRWACGFAAMQVRRYRSQSAKQRVSFSDAAVDSLVQEWPQASSFMDDCRQSLSECIKKLGRVERQVIEAKYCNHLSVKDISTMTGRPESTVYKILIRGRESLRACVKRFQLESHS
jgi:RNA polymerase sigma-70 factor (ECF subfamily)